MAFDTKKTILLEKQYFYVKAQKGFKLRGTSTEIIPTNTGFYRFLVSNLTFALGNSYIDVFYDSTDMTFQAYCSDLFMENVQNTVTVAVENMNVDLAHFAQQNHSDITLFATQVGEDMGTLGNGISAGLKQVDDDVKATGGVAHEDAQAIKDAVDNIDLSPVTAFKDANHADIEGLGSTVGTALGAVDTDIKSASEQAHSDSVAFKDAIHTDLEGIQANIPSVDGLALDASLQSILAKLGDWLKQATFEEFATVLSTALQLLHTDNESIKTSVDALGKDSSLKALDESVKAVPSSLAKDATVSDFATGVGGALQAINTILTAISTSNEVLPSFRSENITALGNIWGVLNKVLGQVDSINSTSANSNSEIKGIFSKLGDWVKSADFSEFATALSTALQAVNTNLEAVNTGTTEIPNFKAQSHEDIVAFKGANHADLTALLAAFNSLAEELKKKLAFNTSRIRFPDSLNFVENPETINLACIGVGEMSFFRKTNGGGFDVIWDSSHWSALWCFCSSTSRFSPRQLVLFGDSDVILSANQSLKDGQYCWTSDSRDINNGKIHLVPVFSSGMVYDFVFYRLA